MGTTLLQKETTGQGDAPPVAAGLFRQAIYFDSRGETLFGWLHGPGHPAPQSHGVVLCPPLGHEHLHSQRSLRHLADALAGAGFLVLRFDYRGTGDSAGGNEAGGNWAAWR